MKVTKRTLFSGCPERSWSLLFGDVQKPSGRGPMSKGVGPKDSFQPHSDSVIVNPTTMVLVCLFVLVRGFVCVFFCCWVCLLVVGWVFSLRILIQFSLSLTTVKWQWTQL